jgi:serine/threonine-protein kinase
LIEWAETHLARGDYLYRGLREYDRALGHYETALRMAPNDTRAMESIAYIYRRQGKMDEHLAQLEAAYRLDPQNANIASNLAMSYRALRRFDAAVPMYERAEELNPNDYRLRLNRANSMIAWKGDVAAARRIIEEKPKPGDVWYTVGLLVVHLVERDFDGALEQARQFGRNTPPLTDLATMVEAHMVAEHDLDVPGAPTLEDAARVLEKDIEESPSASGSRGRMAINLALRGEHDAAVREARLAVDLAAKDAFSGPEQVRVLAEVYMLVGRHDEAIDTLDQLLNTVYEDSITREWLRLAPGWDPLRDHPRFQALLASGES